MSIVNNFIDIHNHILPNVDDGAINVEMAIDMIKKHIEDGTKALILTPHLYHSASKATKEEILKKFNILKEVVEKEALPIELYLGSEIYYREHIKIDYENSSLNNTKYVLIEFSTLNRTDIREICFNISKRGYKPIIAHIERYKYLSNKDYDQIKKDGTLFQVNAKSIIHPDKPTSKIIKYLLKNKFIDFIATDAHNMDNRKPNLKEAYHVLKKKLDETYLEKIFYLNAIEIIKTI